MSPDLTSQQLSSYLREVIQVLRAGLGSHCHPVHLIVEPIQEEAKELLSILLTEPRESEGAASTSTLLVPPPLWGGQADMRSRPLLIANEAWCVSLNLGLELRWAHHIIGG